MTWKIWQGDCRDAMEFNIADDSVDVIVTDPPYELGFMGKAWDKSGVAFDPETWRHALVVLKPGGHLLAFGGTRTYHRMVCAIEDAGFEVRDQIGWVYGSGFPKSKNLDGDWEGWGTALKPAWEPIVLARKPLIGTVAANVLAHGCGALNIDGCRVLSGDDIGRTRTTALGQMNDDAWEPKAMKSESHALGRWPANLIHDGGEEVLAAFPQVNSGGNLKATIPSPKTSTVYGGFPKRSDFATYRDTGSAARFFYCAKASKRDRGEGNTHPTVKPTDLMRYLCRLVTPPGGLVLDPFTGSGSTGKAAVLEGFRFVGCELNPEYIKLAEARIAAAEAEVLW